LVLPKNFIDSLLPLAWRLDAVNETASYIIFYGDVWIEGYKILSMSPVVTDHRDYTDATDIHSNNIDWLSVLGHDGECEFLPLFVLLIVSSFHAFIFNAVVQYSLLIYHHSLICCL